MPLYMPVKDALLVEDMGSTTSSIESSVFDSIPLSLILWLARPYLAGRTAQDAIERAHKIFRKNDFSSTLDILGEDSTTEEDCQNAVHMYLELIDLLSQNQLSVTEPRRRVTISFKPSMFAAVDPTSGQAKPAELDNAFVRIKKVVDYALEKKVNMTLEAEDHNWTDFQLETYFALLKDGYTNLGTVLQSRLFRTRNDIRRFDERGRVRLVIGIYNEPAEISHTQKSVMKDLVVEYAGNLINKGTYVELASHDFSCIDNFMTKVAIPQKVLPHQFETQFLLGVPRQKLQEQLVSGAYFTRLSGIANSAQKAILEYYINDGALVRMYLPYGKDHLAAAYCKRRLKANPNMIAFGIKNLLHLN